MKSRRKNNNTRNRKAKDCNSAFAVSSTLQQLQGDAKKNPMDVRACLALADYYQRNGMEIKIVELIKPLSAQHPFDDETLTKLYNRLLAYGYAHADMAVKAEEVCAQSEQLEPDGLDFLFIRSFIHMKLREYEKVVSNANRFIEQLRIQRKSNDRLYDYAVTESHLSQVYNFLGSAHLELTNWSEARENCEKSRQIDPGNHLPYLNLARIAHHHRDFETEAGIIKDGLTNCRQVQEIRLLAGAIKQQTTVSACMIVKNEEELLPECLESVRDWVDEIIVVDTGSTDRTVEIAESFGAKVFHQPWEGDFSKHRNYSVELATSEWIFIIDADERLQTEDLPILRSNLDRHDVRIMSINIYNVYGNQEQLTTFLPSVRFWRKSENLRYEGIVHNLLKLGPEHPVLRVPVRIKHLGYDLSIDKMQKKFIRTRALLEKQIEDNSDDFFALFNLAQLLTGGDSKGTSHDWVEIAKIAEKAISITDPNDKAERHVHLMTLNQAGWARFENGEYEKAEEHAERAIGLKSNYLDPLLLMGSLFGRKGEYDKAIKAYERYIEVQESYNADTENDCLILTHVDSRPNAWFALALIAESKADFDKSRQYLQKVVDAQPGYRDSNCKLARIYLREGNNQSAEKYFRQQLDFTPNAVDAIFGLAAVLEASHRYDDAERHYRDVLVRTPHNHSARVRFAKMLRMVGREQDAIDLLQLGTEFDGAGEVHRELADLYLRNGQTTEAVERLQAVIDSDGPDGPLLNDLGNCYFKMKQFEAAAEFYHKSLEIESDQPATIRNLGLTLARLEQDEQAIEILDKYTQSNPGEQAILQVLADLYAKTGDNQTALRHYEKYLAIEPTNHTVLFGLSECYLRMGHTDSAIIGYRRLLEISPDFKPALQRLESLLQAVQQT